MSGERVSAGLGIITSGVAHLHTLEVLDEMELNVPVLKLGFFYPLAEKKIEKFIKGLKKVLVVEELDVVKFPGKVRFSFRNGLSYRA